MKTTVAYQAACVALAGQAFATSSTRILANYDDLTRQAVDTPIMTYKYLTYQAWDLPDLVSTTVPAHVGGTAVQSPPNDIATDATAQLRGTPSMTIASPYTSVSPYDFYFGCVQNTMEGTVAAAAQCTITVAGFKKGSNQEVALASYTFTPPLDPVDPVPMFHAVLPDAFHQPLYNITVIQNDTLLKLFVDTFPYTVSK